MSEGREESQEPEVDETGELDDVGETLREPAEEDDRNTEDRPQDTW